ncbi:MAG TPA: YggS family pyridoxal phosphate-dependent enzyme [Actinomycetota bacterium]
MTSADEIGSNLAAITEAIRRACERAGRDPGEVLIVGASKTVDLERIRWAHEAGVTAFGENYVQELRRKAPELPTARWHFIGTLQSGTAQHVADLADVVETLAGERATERLARRARSTGRVLDGLVEVDLAGRGTGVPPETVAAFARSTAALGGVRVVGLMTLPPLDPDPEAARPWFTRLRTIRDRLRVQHPEMLELSMGMSLDYPVAVEEGATMVRIGTALFGRRAPLT